MKRLNIGCGHEILPGYVNCDVAALPGVDVRADLSKFPWPFQDNEFSEIRAANWLEHMPDLIPVLEEVHRICAPGAKVYFSVPYWNSFEAITDPTHKQAFNEYTFEFFDPTQSRCQNRPYYSKARFRIERIGYFVRFFAPYVNLPVIRRAVIVFNPVVKWFLGALAAHLGNIIIGLEIYLIADKNSSASLGQS